MPFFFPTWFPVIYSTNLHTVSCYRKPSPSSLDCPQKPHPRLPRVGEFLRRSSARPPPCSSYSGQGSKPPTSRSFSYTSPRTRALHDMLFRIFAQAEQRVRARPKGRRRPYRSGHALQPLSRMQASTPTTPTSPPWPREPPGHSSMPRGTIGRRLHPEPEARRSRSHSVRVSVQSQEAYIDSEISIDLAVTCSTPSSPSPSTSTTGASRTATPEPLAAGSSFSDDLATVVRTPFPCTVRSKDHGHD